MTDSTLPALPVLLDTATVAETLGCSQRTVLMLIHEGALPAIRLGSQTSHYRVTEIDLRDFISRYRVGQPTT